MRRSQCWPCAGLLDRTVTRHDMFYYLGSTWRLKISVRCVLVGLPSAPRLKKPRCCCCAYPQRGGRHTSEFQPLLSHLKTRQKELLRLFSRKEVSCDFLLRLLLRPLRRGFLPISFATFVSWTQTFPICHQAISFFFLANSPVVVPIEPHPPPPQPDLVEKKKKKKNLFEQDEISFLR